MAFDGGIVIITTIGTLVRTLSLGFAAVAVGLAAIGLRFADHEGDEAQAEPIRRDPS
jgi:hypothetical protein